MNVLSCCDGLPGIVLVGTIQAQIVFDGCSGCAINIEHCERGYCFAAAKSQKTGALSSGRELK
jgi:hypothetical protein